jgi:hypothetical protein
MQRGWRRQPWSPPTGCQRWRLRERRTSIAVLSRWRRLHAKLVVCGSSGGFSRLPPPLLAGQCARRGEGARHWPDLLATTVPPLGIDLSIFRVGSGRVLKTWLFRSEKILPLTVPPVRRASIFGSGSGWVRAWAGRPRIL